MCLNSCDKYGRMRGMELEYVLIDRFQMSHNLEMTN